MSESFEIPETPEPSQTPAAGEITSDDKLWALLAYVFSPLVPIILMLIESKKDRPFLRAHNAQALVLGLINTVLTVVLSATLVLGCIPMLVWFYMVYLGVQAYQGKMVEVPVITNFVKSQGWA